MTDSPETRTKRLVVLMTPSEMKAVADYQFENRIRSQGDAARRLIALGLETAKKRKPTS